MEVILRDEVKNLGFQGELVEVADGYARNYLIPQTLAVRATRENREKYERQKEKIEARKEERRAQAQDLADSLSATELTLEKAASDEGTLYGSVTPGDIVEALQDKGFEDVSTKQVIFDESLNELGEYTVRIGLVEDIEAEVEVEIVPA